MDQRNKLETSGSGLARDHSQHSYSILSEDSSTRSRRVRGAHTCLKQPKSTPAAMTGVIGGPKLSGF